MTRKLSIFVAIIIVLSAFFVMSVGATNVLTFVPIENSEMPISTCNNLATVIEAEGKIYQIGGSVGGNTPEYFRKNVYAYDLNSNTWKTLASYPIITREMSAVYLNGKIYCVGGVESPTGTHNKVYAYDIATNIWTQKASIPMSSTRMCGIAAVDGKIYVAGGARISSGINNTLYTYDPKTNIWTQKANLIIPAASYCATNMVYHNGELYFFANNLTYNPNTLGNGSQKYNIAENKWYKINSLPSPQMNTYAVGTVGDDIYVIRGDKSFKYINSSDMWEEISIQPFNPLARSGIIVNNKVYSMGFQTASGYNNRMFVMDLSSLIPAEPENPIEPKADKQLAVHLDVGETFRLSVTGDTADNSNFIWTSDDESVATVNANGAIIGISPGLCKITAQDSTGFIQSILVRVEVNDNNTETITYTKINDTDPQVTYAGTWHPYGGDPSFYASDEQYSNEVGAYAEFSFTGTAIRWISTTSDNLGKCDVYVDGALEVQGMDLYSDSLEAQKILFDKSSLSNGSHTIKIVVTGEKNSSATEAYVTIDAFEYCA